MLNRQERVAVLLLSGALLVGTAASVLDYYDPSRLEEFSVLPGAVPVPAPMVDRSSVEALPLAELGPVAINSATARELERLPAIGPKTAAIIDQRQSYLTRSQDRQRMLTAALRRLRRVALNAKAEPN